MTPGRCSYCMDLGDIASIFYLVLNYKIKYFANILKMVKFKVWRDAKTGRFIPVKVAERRKATAIVETIKR